MTKDYRYQTLETELIRCEPFCPVQVLRLFHFLVKFGYYGSDDIKALLKPLLNLLNGKLDKPFPPDTEKGGKSIYYPPEVRRGKYWGLRVFLL